MEGGDNGRARQQVSIRNLGPGSDLVVARRILFLDSFCVASVRRCMWVEGQDHHTTNVGKLAVLEDDEELAAGNLLEGAGSAVRPVGDDVTMRLENADGIAYFFS